MGVSEGQIPPFLPKRGLNIKFGSEQVNSDWCSALMQTSGEDGMALLLLLP